jgi:outer membrane lipoprotein
MSVMLINTTIRSGWLVLILLMAACSSSIPVEIRQTLVNAPGVALVRGQPDSYLSQQVRWGGMILETENKQNSSWLTIIAFPLSDRGEPQTSARSPGRFIARVDEFLEPLVYGRDRLITVKGSFSKTEMLMVGEYPYLYPVIDVEHYYLWPVKQVPHYVDYPPYWRYDPWYYPGYPWRYPYRYPGHRHH